MWLIPSRSRPHRLAETIRACRETGMTTPAVVRLDADDPMLGGYEALDRPRDWAFVVARREPLSAVYNGCFRLLPDLDWYGFLSDDVTPETPGWDRMLISAAGRDGLAFGDDGINGAAHAAHFVLGGDLVRGAGFLSLPGLQRIFIDTVWNDIARHRGTFRYLPGVRMTHRHFSNGKALMDATYRKTGKTADRATYEAWRRQMQLQARRPNPCP